MTTSRRLLALLGLLTAAPALSAEEPPRGDRLVLSLPLASAETSPASRLPSWEQAVFLSTDAFLLAHDAVLRATEGIPIPWVRGLARGLGSILSDFIVWKAVDPAWAHEEGHRAVLARFDIASDNGAVDPPGAWPPSYRPVYGVTDAQLAFLKEHHNPDMVRLSAAGMETELQAKALLERQTFFADRPGGQNILSIAYTNLSVISYYSVCLDQRQTEAVNQDEARAVGTDVFRRDFTGADCLAWAYDIDRPDEPYAARGPHPSGVGIRRDRLPSDLTDSESRYLRRQRNLLLLNLVDPQQFGFAGFPGVDPFTHQPLRWTAMLAHTPTSFGSATEARVFLAEAEWKLGATLHGFTNGDAFFPGLTAELYRYPLHPLGHPLDVSALLSLWLQPRDQRFHTASAAPGAMAAITVSQRLFDALDLDLRLRAKTAGWVPLHAELGPAVDLTLGASLLLP